MESIVVFLLSGLFPMSAALAAAKLTKLPEEERPGWTAGERGLKRVLLLGNLSGLVLVAALWFGFTHMAWWIPPLCLVLTFPVIHLVLIERLFGPAKSLLFSSMLALAAVGLLWLHW